MSKISDIYTALDGKISSVLTGYTKLPDSYSTDENNILYLQKGYGIGYGTGENTQRVASCQLSMSQSFNVVIVNLVTTTDHNTTARNTLEKALMEDVYGLIKAVEKDSDLGNACSKASFTSHGGIELLEEFDARFFAISIDFEIEFFDSLI